MSDQPIRETLRHPAAGVPVAVFWRRADTIGRYRHPLHWHPETEFHVITKGGGTYLIGDEMHAVKRHSLVIIHGREVHKLIQAPGGCDRVTLQARLNRLSRGPRRLPHHATLVGDETNHLIGLLRRIKAELDDQRPFWESTTRIRLDEFLLSIRRATEPWNESAVAVNPLMRELIAYLDANFMRALALQDVSEAFGYSSSYLSRSFSEAFGATIYDYIRHRRIAEADAIMRTHPDRKLSAIARETGFRNYTTFARNFENVARRSPSEYRETMLTTCDNGSGSRRPLRAVSG